MAGRYRALLIGNSVYPADEHNLQPLKGPAKDIAVLNRALVDRDAGLFADVDVTLLPETTSARATRALGRFFGAAERDDVLLFYFSGHGKLDQSGRLHLCMQDTESSDLLSTAVSSARLNEFVDASRARHVVIVLDCCYAGAFRGADLGSPVAGPGRYVMTSCRSTQLANDATIDNGTSYFTQHLVDGLVGAAPDSDADGFIGFSDLYAYVDKRLRSEGKQIPLRRVDGDGDLRLARRPADAPQAAIAPPPPPPSAPSTDHRAASRAPRGWVIGGAAAAVVVAAAAIAFAVSRTDGAGSPSSSGPYVRTGIKYQTSGSYLASGPWRLQVIDRIEHKDGGCRAQVTDPKGVYPTAELTSAYESTILQVPHAGRFLWRVEDPECEVSPAPGSGKLKVPATVVGNSGDTEAFPVSGQFAVQVKDFQGSDACTFDLRDAEDGTLLDHAELTHDRRNVSLHAFAATTAYLNGFGCVARIG